MQKLKRNSNPRNRVGCYESAKAKFKNPRCGQACHAKAKAQTDQGVSNSFRIAWPTTISQENTKTQALHPKTRINACNRPLHKIPTPQSASQNISKIADQFQYPPCIYPITPRRCLYCWLLSSLTPSTCEHPWSHCISFFSIHFEKSCPNWFFRFLVSNSFLLICLTISELYMQLPVDLAD